MLGALGVLWRFWSIIKKQFASREEFEELKKDFEGLRKSTNAAAEARAEKLSNQIDHLVVLLERKSHKHHE